MAAIFDTITQPVPERIAAGLSRIAVAMRSAEWRSGGLTPTQGRIMTLLVGAAGGLKPSDLAERLRVSRPTISDAVATLRRKGLVEAVDDAGDGRSRNLLPTPAGHAAAAEVAGWPAFLVRAVGELPDTQQVALLRGLIGTIRSLQRRGEIPVARMCVTCRYFRPNAHPDPLAPHHCAYVDAPFGDRHLRLDCPEHDAAPNADQQHLWTRFLASDPPPNGTETAP